MPPKSPSLVARYKKYAPSQSHSAPTFGGFFSVVAPFSLAHLLSLRFALHQVSRIPQPSPQDPAPGATPPCSRLPHQVSRIPQPSQLATSSTIVGDGVIRLLCNLFSPLFGAAVRGDQESGVRWAGYGGVLEPQQEVTQVSCHTLG
jgi:hypothetical protein